MKLNSINPVEIKNIQYEYKDHRVFNKVTLSVERGEFLSIVGPNGSGKTTLLKLISGLLFPSVGEIYLFSEQLNSTSADRLRQHVGFVAQGSIRTRIPIPVIDAVLLGGYGKKRLFSRISSSESDRASALLKEMGLEELEHRDYMALSGGQQQKVAVSRCLFQEPDLLLLDEPTTYLDEPSQHDIMEHISEIHQTRNITIIFVCHNRELVDRYSTRILHIKDYSLTSNDPLHIGK